VEAAQLDRDPTCDTRSLRPRAIARGFFASLIFAVVAMIAFALVVTGLEYLFSSPQQIRERFSLASWSSVVSYVFYVLIAGFGVFVGSSRDPRGWVVISLAIAFLLAGLLTGAAAIQFGSISGIQLQLAAVLFAGALAGGFVARQRAA
jgi:uncharacterized membrane protein